MVASEAPVSSSATDHSLMDGVAVINLASRTDRLERFQQQAASIRQLRGWVQIPAIRGVDLPGFGQQPWFHHRHRDKTWAGRAGCILSHRKAIAHAREQGWERVLILEDDAKFDTSLADFLDRYSQSLLQSGAEWDICYLGFAEPFSPYRKLYDFDDQYSLYGIHSVYTAHAYILSSATYDWLLEQLPTEENIWPWLARHRAIDRWYTRQLTPRFKTVVVSPTLIGQHSDFSDNGQRHPGDDRHQDLHNRLSSHQAITSATLYHLLLQLRTLQFRLSGVMDALRGAIKRLRGF